MNSPHEKKSDDHILMYSYITIDKFSRTRLDIVDTNSPLVLDSNQTLWRISAKTTDSIDVKYNLEIFTIAYPPQGNFESKNKLRNVRKIQH